MNVRTFVARIDATHGEHTFTLSRLIVANSETRALAVALDAMAEMYGDPSEEDGGSLLVCNGEIRLELHSLREIGLATYLDMRSVGLAETIDRSARAPVVEDLDTLKGVSSATHKALKAKNVAITSSQVLNAVASAVGSRDWAQYKATAVAPVAKDEPAESATSIPRPEWTSSDSFLASRQGWGIFSVNLDDARTQQLVKGKQYGDRPFELQADGDAGRFDDDEQAHEFVRKAIQAGDPLAIRAGQYLQAHSPVEYEALMST